MVDSRLKLPPPRLLESFLEVLAPEQGQEPALKRYYPDEFEEKEGTLKQVPRFCYPCQTDSVGVQYFTFVLTDIDGKFRFGFCRYPPHAPSCICLISYVPWYEMFYVILNNIQDLELKGDNRFVHPLLDELLSVNIPEPGSEFTVEIEIDGGKKTFKYEVPDTTKLPSIPASRNLTEYFAAITPEIMIQIFISMLFERRILITSKRLSLLTAVIHGSVSLLYPMQWQHIYVPVLPPHLLDYCCAPMPFLVGVHSSMMESVQMMPLDEVVIVNADTNEIHYPFQDLEIFPHDVYSKLLGKIKKTERALEDYVATQFLKALVSLIGGYRDALKFKDGDDGGKIVFEEDLFLDSRPSYMRPFLEFVLSLQSFQQFVACRLDMLNSGIGFADIFEDEIAEQSANHSKQKTQYQQWLNKMKKGGGVFKKTVGERYLHLKAKASDVELKDKIKFIYKGAKSGVKTGYKGAKKNLKDVKHYLKPKDAVDGEENTSKSNPGSPVSRHRIRSNPVKRQSSMPSAKAFALKDEKFRHTVYSSMPAHRVHHGSPKVDPIKPRTPPPRPPPPTAMRKSQSNDALEKRASVIIESDCNSSSSSTPPLARQESDDVTPFDILIDLDAIRLEEDDKSRQKQDLPSGGTANPAFTVFDDTFCVIGDEEPQLETPKPVVFRRQPPPPPRPDLIPDPPSDLQISKQTNLSARITTSATADMPDLMQFNRDTESEKFVLISPDKEAAEFSLADLLGPTGPTETMSSLEALDPIFPHSELLQETAQCVSPETRLFLYRDSSSPDVAKHSYSTSASNPKGTNVDLLGGLSPPRSKPPLPLKPAHLTSKEHSKVPEKDPFEDLIIHTKNTITNPSLNANR